MSQVIYVEFNGARHVIDVADGVTVMEGAVQNGVPGIDATCGGACACATCHVYIDPAWRDIVGDPAGDEAEMLEFAEHVRENSRLSCQIRMSRALDGLVVAMPETQG